MAAIDLMEDNVDGVEAAVVAAAGVVAAEVPAVLAAPEAEAGKVTWVTEVIGASAGAPLTIKSGDPPEATFEESTALTMPV